ncbi:hypothetical protein [Antrihabitans sp. YC2-6]|uniref:hypothetical protein n=1 Tax=Antrihabitans sp. YC2-6 TaxID=2799498 RepID=UPI0018F5CC92|nr:hypothetical protein [Antrihabitans sp. YC2-6]MBJ8344280.1 hypothetical protein [Antrihabitans sp. YC2-6]
MNPMQRVLWSAVGAALLLLGVIAPAAAAPPNPAAPDAVSVSAWAVNKTVTIRVTNSYSAPLTVCGVFLFKEPNYPHNGTPQNFWGPVDIQPGETREWVSTTFPMFNGNYQVYWTCSAVENGAEVRWGTETPSRSAGDGWTPTAAPVPVVVNAPTCLGAVCIPPGLGF